MRTISQTGASSARPAMRRASACGAPSATNCAERCSSSSQSAGERKDSRRAASVPTPWPKCPITSRSEEHTSELQSLMRISYAVFCLKKKKKEHKHTQKKNTKQQNKNISNCNRLEG